MASSHLSEGEFKSGFTKAAEDDYEVCTKKIDWSRLDGSSASDIDKIKLLAGNPDEMHAPDDDIDAIFRDESEAQATCRAILSVLNTRDPTKLTYFLTLLSHIFLSDTKRAKVFVQLTVLGDSPATGGGDDEAGRSASPTLRSARMGVHSLVKNFSRVWIRDDFSAFTRGKAAICGAYILNYFDYAAALEMVDICGTEKDKEEARETAREVKGAFESLNNFIISAMMRSSGDDLELPLYALKAVIKNSDFQRIFIKEDGLDRLFEVFEEHSEHRQVTYLACFTLWTLSFYPDKYANSEMLLNGALISRLVSIVQLKTSQKVIRVVLAFFVNLLGLGNFNEMLALFKFHITLESMLEEGIEDPEQKSCAEALLVGLSQQVKVLSSMERYVSELNARKLVRGPCHTELFWKKYHKAFEEDDFKYIKQMLELLGSHDAETKAIACYDLGEWSRFYPDGNRVIATLGGKLKLMLLIDDKHPEVRRQAIAAVQKILIKNWQALGTGAAADGADAKTD